MHKPLHLRPAARGLLCRRLAHLLLLICFAGSVAISTFLYVHIIGRSSGSRLCVAKAAQRLEHMGKHQASYHACELQRCIRCLPT
jgi:hypothetical protein